MKIKLEEIINELKSIDSVYIIGHNGIDADSYFSSYVLSKILKSFNINAYFTILSNYVFSQDDKELIADYLKDKPLILNIDNIESKKFILVDHNDLDQSLKNNGEVLFSIDHHIDCKKISKCYSSEYTSTLLYIYDLFKDIYNFSENDKLLVALSVICDSEYLTTSRFGVNDKKIYDELSVCLDVNQIRNKYFKTTDFSLDIHTNIEMNYKLYNILGNEFNRVILKIYSCDRIYIDEYLKELDNCYDNYILICNEYDTSKTLVFYNGLLTLEYDYILSSSVLIIKDILSKHKKVDTNI